MVLGVKNPPANAGRIRDVASILGSGGSPGGGMATHSRILAWRTPWTEDLMYVCMVAKSDTTAAT